MGYLTLTSGFKMDALDPSLENSGWLKLSESCVAVVCVQLHGIAQVSMLYFMTILSKQLLEYNQYIAIPNRDDSSNVDNSRKNSICFKY